jgi:hypothetical protein
MTFECFDLKDFNQVNVADIKKLDYDKAKFESITVLPIKT